MCIILSLLTCLVLVLLKRYSNPETIARTQKQTASNPPPELIQGPGNGEEIGRRCTVRGRMVKGEAPDTHHHMTRSF